ncbi:tRNA epoxyqueuosine(34) reductase QueG [Zooshikella ganghwensis]|uniref:tRNA epoxyqueuosine(34) reductase QueG n=1 Tax=Zooshikella ganghwensis TaxID=202772 RepID=UPI000423C537|nr:tRNA epoxyqueuosine(34) reductase QueG [Zooshikella ganghwensis]
MTNIATSQTDFGLLAQQIKLWARELGFQDAGITSIDLSEHETYLKSWLAKGFHGEMGYLADHGNKRSRPDELVPGTISIISVRMDYLPGDTQAVKVLQSSSQAYISRYALGRDYHKVIRKRLAKLANKITEVAGHFGYRAFVDSAPVLEKALAEKAGLGWIGKNTLLLNSKAGSWFFLGELYTNLPLPIDTPQATKHCGSCQACLDICPTDAFVGPFQLDARKCISYLTIELKEAIPEALRPKIGNRVFGCDDCQLVCPWNKFAKPTQETDFLPRHKLDSSDLTTLFLWTEEQFLSATEGSPIRRTGYKGWLRNLAVGLGNAATTPEVIAALNSRKDFPDDMVREHILWALKQHHMKTTGC